MMPTYTTTNDWLVVASPEDGIEVTRDVGSIDNPDIILPVWSPDGRYFQLTYIAQNNFLIAIVGADGTNFPSIATSLKTWPYLGRGWKSAAL